MKTLVQILVVSISLNVNAQELHKLVDLKGKWSFTIGDDFAWSKQYIKTDDWDLVKVPSAWEDQGYNGYDGFAWYRKTFSIKPNTQSSNLLLRLGRIDDVSQIFLNGKSIGIIGAFPTNYKTAYDQWIEFTIPQSLFNVNQQNTIAVRVYDAELSGGIIEGDIAIYEITNDLILELNLSGEWKFNPQDKSEYKNPRYNDSKWNSVFVPSPWEKQGYLTYDGFAWYRKAFKVPERFKEKKMVLLLGKIDDIDEVYLNGKLIGSTGDFRNLNQFNRNGEWQKLRSYFLVDNSLINFNGENVIAVRVYDGFEYGGIYEGPIGLAEQSTFAAYVRNKNQREKQKSKSFLWRLFFE